MTTTRSEEKENKQEYALQNLYRAPNPYPPQPTGFRVLDFVINGVASIPNKIFGGVSSMPILPAQMLAPVSLNPDALKYYETNYPVRFQQQQVLTYDQALLDTLEVRYTLPKEKDIYIVKFNGNGARYELGVDAMVQDAVRLKANIIAFNYRGVSHSKGNPSSKTKLVTDGIAEVQRLLALGVDPHHIVLDGLSLGGGIATLVAKHFHDQGIRVNLFNDRSFSSVSSAGARMLVEGKLSELMVSAVESTSYSSLAIADWDIDAASAYKTIPSQCKAYIFVDDKKVGVDNVGDGIIPHKSSLHKKLDGKRGQGTHWVRMFAPKPLKNGHNAAREELVSAEDRSGQVIFEEFVKRVTY